MRAILTMWLVLAAAPVAAMLPDTEPRRSASEYAVAVAAKVDAVASFCSTLPAPEGPAMARAHAAWRTRNEALAQAAREWRVARHAAIGRERGDAVARSEQRQFDADVAALVSRGVDRVRVDGLPGAPPDVTRCGAYVALLEYDQLELAAHAEFGPLLEELAGAR
jgi:hypothetical protein